MKMAASSAATSADGLWKEPMHGSSSFADCWFGTSICSPFTTLLLPRVLLDHTQEAFLKQALANSGLMSGFQMRAGFAMM